MPTRRRRRPSLARDGDPVDRRVVEEAVEEAPERREVVHRRAEDDGERRARAHDVAARRFGVGAADRDVVGGRVEERVRRLERARADARHDVEAGPPRRSPSREHARPERAVLPAARKRQHVQLVAGPRRQEPVERAVQPSLGRRRRGRRGKRPRARRAADGQERRRDHERPAGRTGGRRAPRSRTRGRSTGSGRDAHHFFDASRSSAVFAAPLAPPSGSRSAMTRRRGSAARMPYAPQASAAQARMRW